MARRTRGSARQVEVRLSHVVGLVSQEQPCSRSEWDELL
jgi:hypothetical protein